VIERTSSYVPEFSSSPSSPFRGWSRATNTETERSYDGRRMLDPMKSALSRTGAVVALLAVLFGLCVWFGTLAPAPEVGAYPDSDDIGPSPTEYVGTDVEIGGRVVATEPVVVELSYGTASRRVTVTDVSHPVTEGDTLRVFGTLTDSETIRASNSFAVPPSGAVYTYSISFLAGLWVLVRLVTQWRVDSRRGLVRRTRTLRAVRWLRHRVSPEEVTDSDA